MQKKHWNRTSTLAALAVLAVILSATCVLAQGPGHPHGMMGRMGPGHGQGMGQGMGQGNMTPMLADKLDLTEDQQAAIDGIHEQARKDNLELRKQLMRLRNELQGEMLKDDPTQKTVLNLTAKIGALRTEMQTNRVKARLAVRKQLTPEQRDMMLMMGPGNHKGRGGRESFGGHGGFGPGHGPACDGSGPGRNFGPRNWDDD